ncbi:PREDICTED: uncharacterized protein LOC104376380 isoform X2 [Tauraco erythrolophus]|uniref:uncharacterized protein LOC104376380 isoform X2 n=1 Tax=Tauraco erythrolophus TaxID=121530 RepID=UPI000523A395|nr:PREDICTED: uncharacterized protein LOC104376380 isoform X2 [Tauraco erythrolophus]
MLLKQNLITEMNLAIGQQPQRKRSETTTFVEEMGEDVEVVEEDKEGGVAEDSKETMNSHEQITVSVTQERQKGEQQMDLLRSELTAIMKGVSTLKHYRIPPVKGVGCARVKNVIRRKRRRTAQMANSRW